MAGWGIAVGVILGIPSLLVVMSDAEEVTPL
jgi:hypothetical protein